MYAILETGGKQYKVETGDVIEVERLGGEPGDQIEVGRVLMLGDADGKSQFGNPGIDGAKVFGEVVEQGKGEKLIIFKYKPKVRYRRKTGHRQLMTLVRIGDIVGPEGDAPSEARADEVKAEAVGPDAGAPAEVTAEEVAPEESGAE